MGGSEKRDRCTVNPYTTISKAYQELFVVRCGIFILDSITTQAIKENAPINGLLRTYPPPGPRSVAKQYLWSGVRLRLPKQSLDLALDLFAVMTNKFFLISQIGNDQLRLGNLPNPIQSFG